MVELFFDNRIFPDLEEIKEYLKVKNDEAKQVRKTWLEALEEPIADFSDVLDLAFSRDRIKDSNRHPLFFGPKTITRKIRISTDLLHKKELKNSTDYIDLSETKTRKGKLLYADIRMMYPMNLGGTPPPWAQEVYSLVIRPPKTDYIFQSADQQNVTQLFDGEVDIPKLPELIVQPSKEFLQWEKQMSIIPPKDEIGHHVFTGENVARIVFAHAIDQVSQALRNPFSICESFEEPQFPKSVIRIPLTRKVRI